MYQSNMLAKLFKIKINYMKPCNEVVLYYQNTHMKFVPGNVLKKDLMIEINNLLN